MQNIYRLNRLTIGFLVLIVLISGCTAAADKPISLASVLPEPPVQGWSVVDKPREFSTETLYDLVNGQADAYLAYGFRQAAVGRYQGPAQDRLQIEIFGLDSQEDAYGLFTSSRAGSPVQVGVDGDTDPGRRIVFWQDRYLVRIISPQILPESDILAFAQALSQSLPSGGEAPRLVGQLPEQGLEPDSILFFHEEISIQSRLWLGGQNILGLNQETDGVLASYSRDGTGQLLVLHYPQDNQARQGLQSLQSADIPQFLTAEVQNNSLAAVFGDMDNQAAASLVDEVFQ